MPKMTLRCPVAGCDRDGFDGLWGVKVHYARTHKKPKWQDEWDELVTHGQQLPASQPTPTQGGFIFRTLVDALSNHPKRAMSIQELIPVFAEKGYSSSLEALRQGIASCAKTHPDMVERAERGVYRLRTAKAKVSKQSGGELVKQVRAMVKREQQVAPLLDNALNGEVSSLRAEVARLRRANARKQEVIMVLTRLAIEED